MGKRFCYTIIYILLQTATGFSTTFAQDSISGEKKEFQPMSFEIEEVIIRPKKERYSRQDNPAVELIRKVIEHKKKNRIENKDEYKVEKYEKLSLSLDDFKPEKKFLFKQFSFIKSYLDTLEWYGKPTLTFSIRETLADYYYRKEPQTKKTIIKAKREQGVDQLYDNNGTISSNLEEIFREIDIFDNDITLLLNKFVSPLSSTLAVSYYKYYITDTLDIQGNQCVELVFAPVNDQTYSFTGQLYVTLDGNYSVKKALLHTPSHINLNWVGQIHIEQEFCQTPDSTWVLCKENTYSNFYPIKGVPQLYAHLFRSFDNYDFAPTASDSVFRLLGSVHIIPEATMQADTFWIDNRHIPLSEKEEKLPHLLAEFDSVPIFNIGTKILDVLIFDYVPFNFDKKKNPFDFGRLTSLLNSNYTEGFRVCVGGVTTANLHPQWFAGGYLAYGFDDRKVKYQVKLIHSFNKKKYHENESPVNNLSLLHGYDVYIAGEDNIFAVKVGKQETKMQYIQRTQLQYEKEWLNNLTMRVWTRYEKNQSAGTLQYNQYLPDGTFAPVSRFTISELGLRLRFAPKEKKYDSRVGKGSIFNFSKDAPIFKISHQTGLNGIFQSDYSYNHTEASAEKRIWLSSFGHIDSHLKAGKVWDRVPFPLLIFPNANQSIMIEPETFMMMRAMEFISDEYASFFMTYYMKGWILNRIPLIRKLKLREVVSVSGMYGKLSDKNNPLINPTGLFQLPEEVGFFGKGPYVEASVGIENIFKIVRIDYFRRLSYLNVPDIEKGGFRIALRFSF